MPFSTSRSSSRKRAHSPAVPLSNATRSRLAFQLPSPSTSTSSSTSSPPPLLLKDLVGSNTQPTRRTRKKKEESGSTAVATTAGPSSLASTFTQLHPGDFQNLSQAPVYIAPVTLSNIHPDLPPYALVDRPPPLPSFIPPAYHRIPNPEFWGSLDWVSPTYRRSRYNAAPTPSPLPSRQNSPIVAPTSTSLDPSVRRSTRETFQAPLPTSVPRLTPLYRRSSISDRSSPPPTATQRKKRAAPTIDLATASPTIYWRSTMFEEPFIEMDFLDTPENEFEEGNEKRKIYVRREGGDGGGVKRTRWKLEGVDERRESKGREWNPFDPDGKRLIRWAWEDWRMGAEEDASEEEDEAEALPHTTALFFPASESDVEFEERRNFLDASSSASSPREDSVAFSSTLPPYTFNFSPQKPSRHTREDSDDPLLLDPRVLPTPQISEPPRRLSQVQPQSRQFPAAPQQRPRPSSSEMIQRTEAGDDFRSEEESRVVGPFTPAKVPGPTEQTKDAQADGLGNEGHQEEGTSKDDPMDEGFWDFVKP
ncbi:hypothetical protein P7C70_g3193, partial [Phenoliferia sp. Uapishka_3]